MKTKRNLDGHRPKLNEVFGTEELCAWLYWQDGGKQTVRIQTREPGFVKAIKQLGRGRDQVRLVAWGCSGGYLRVFELEMPFLAAAAFVARQLESVLPPKAA